MTSEDKNDLEVLFSSTNIVPVSASVINKAIALRQQQKLSLGNALIASTALINELTLVTRNTKDFEWIEDLNLLNPIDNEIDIV